MRGEFLVREVENGYVVQPFDMMGSIHNPPQQWVAESLPKLEALIQWLMLDVIRERESRKEKVK